MSRRQRQLEELHSLCRSGALSHAIDLAFEHFADFGYDNGIVTELADAIDRMKVPDDICRRFAELRAAQG